MIATAPTLTAPTLDQLKQRMAALYDRMKQAERALNDDIDPEWLAVAHAVGVCLDATEEALTQADMARTGNDPARARRRLSVAWNKLQEAGDKLNAYEVEHGR